MTINKDDYELMKPLLDDPNKRIIVDVTLPESQFTQMMRLLGQRLLKVTQDFGNSTHYGLTERGEEEVRNYEANAVDDMIAEADVNKYPALFENKVTGVVVLGINPTCGTIVKEATVEFEIGQFPLYVGTFQTCFQPFFDETVWKRVNSVTIEL
jgi:hypothetical protein|nr:MAG TPA_asm: hypothetical protein [Caudoviricetes sp.]